MIYNRVVRKFKKLLGFKPQVIFYDDTSHVEVSCSAVFTNSRIELKGVSRLIISEGVVIDGMYIMLEDSELIINPNVKLSKGNIYAKNNSIIKISSSVHVDTYDLTLEHSNLYIGENCYLNQGRSALRPYIAISQGELHIADHNVIRADFWIRYGGVVKIGQYNCINELTEIRCDESITIGDFNMISYDCNIWDTNTHCIYDPKIRREKTITDFPIIGKESERPKTNPIHIGNDCWVGKGAVILKGSTLQDNVVVATKAIVSNKVVKHNRKIVSIKAIEI